MITPARHNPKRGSHELNVAPQDSPSTTTMRLLRCAAPPAWPCSVASKHTTPTYVPECITLGSIAGD